MYFFKDTNGNWIIGASVDTIVSKVPCILRRLSPTSVEIKAIKNGALLIPVLEVTAIKKNAEGDFYANYAEFVAAVSDFFDNAPITSDEVDAKIGAEVDILSDRIDIVENIANASTGGSLGSIKPTDAAPTPERNGNYTFSIGGNKPAWLTAEAGITTVKAGDGVAVVYAAPSTYSYTHVDMQNVQNMEVNIRSKLAMYGNDPLSILVGATGNTVRCGKSIPAGYPNILRIKFQSNYNIPAALFWQDTATGANLMVNKTVVWTDNGDNVFTYEVECVASTTEISSNLFLAISNTIPVTENVIIQTVSVIKNITIVERFTEVEERVDTLEAVNQTTLIEKAVLGNEGVTSKMTTLKVKKDGTGNFLTIQAALNSITDARIDNQYVVDVYDDFIITDMTQLYLVGTPTVLNTLANPTSAIAMVIGKDWVTVRGFNHKRKLHVLAPYALTGTSFQYIVTVHAQGNFTIENFEIKIKNGRYAIHQESSGSKTSLDYNAVTRYKDLHVEHLGNTDSANGGVAWGSVFAQANGGCSGLKMIYENCKWKSPLGPFYTHDNINFDNAMTMEFYNCQMFLSNGGIDSVAGTTQQKNISVAFTGMGSGVQSRVKIIGCNFFCFKISNSGWSGMALTDPTHDFRNGGAELVGHGNTPMLMPAYNVTTLAFKSSILNGTIEVVNDTSTNVNSAYASIFGNIYKAYTGSVDSYAQVIGTERLVDNANGAKTFSLAYRLGNCSVTNKTLTVKVNGIDHVITFNQDYTQLTGGNLVNPLATILAAINAQITGYAVASTDYIQFDCFSDTYEIGFNASETKSVQLWGKALVRDYTKGWNGWRLAQPGEKIEGISTEQMNAYSAGNLSYGKVLLRGKCTFSTIFPAFYFSTNVLGIMLKAGANGALVTTTVKSEADFIGTGYSTISWNV